MTTTLPTLTGRPDLLDMAHQDRDTRLDRMEQFLRRQAAKMTDAPAEAVDQMVALYREVALRRTAVRDWLGDIPTEGWVKQLAKDFTADDRARLRTLAGR